MFLYFVWKARKLGELGLEEPVVEEARHNDVTFDRERGSLAKQITETENGNGDRIGNGGAKGNESDRCCDAQTARFNLVCHV